MRVRFADGGADIYLSNEYDSRRTLMDIGQLPEGTDIGIDDKSVISHLMFNHCGGDTFYQALYELADRTGSIIYWPAPRPSNVVTKEAVIRDVPPEGFDHATIRVVHSGRDIFKAIGESFGEK